MKRCEAKTRNGTPCKKEAGWGTDHFGEGRCKLHGGITGTLTHGRYSKITRPRIKELLEEYEKDPQPLDLLPEVKLLRALLTDFVERYDEMSDAILAWHGSYGDSYRQAYEAWRELIIHKTETEWREIEPEDLPNPPDPLDYMNKPRQLLDITAVASLVDKVGKMVERIEKIKQEGFITLATLDRILEEFGVEVAKVARKHVTDDAERTALFQELEERWRDIHLEPSTGSKGTAARTRAVN